MLDAKIASALRKIISNSNFRRRVSVEEQRAQQHNRFLRGLQIACMIYDHFQATGAYDVAQGPSDLLNICLRDDDVQDFDTRWNQDLLATGEIPQVKEETSARTEKWEVAFSGKQLDSVQEETTEKSALREK